LIVQQLVCFCETVLNDGVALEPVFHPVYTGMELDLNVMKYVTLLSFENTFEYFPFATFAIYLK